MATVETTVFYRKAARINYGKHVLGQVLLKQGLLLSKRLEVSRLLLESNQGEESFWRRSPVLQSEGDSRKLQLCIWRWVQEFVNNLKDILLLGIQGLMEVLS